MSTEPAGEPTSESWKGSRVQRWQTDRSVTLQFGSVYGRVLHTPEKRLLIAILMDALSQFEKVRNARRPRDTQAREELRSWFFGEDLSWPFSFENVCAHLGLEPDAIRDQLVRTPYAVSEPPPRPRRRR
jgi:hypothetical protein